MSADPQTDRPEVDDPRVLALAKARQQMAHNNPFNVVCPPWDGLTGQEQQLSLLDAQNYLRAALDAGLMPAVPEAAPPTGQAGLREPIAAALYRHEWPGKQVWEQALAMDREAFLAQADAVLSALPADSEPHRLALSAALGLGTSAPWDAIRERAAELAGQDAPVDRAAEEQLGEQLDEAAETIANRTVQINQLTAERDSLGREADRLRKDWVEMRTRAETGRAAVLREAADGFDAHAEQILEGVNDMAAFVAKARQHEAATWREAAETLRRLAAETPTAPPGCWYNAEAAEQAMRTESMAAETPGPDTQGEAHPAEHTWAAELHDPLTDEWVPGTRYITRDRAVNHLAHARSIGPTWKDGTPTERRLVRATTMYTVEAEHQPDTETPDAPRREPHPTEADLRHALAVAAKFHGQAATAPAVTLPGGEA